MASSVVLLLVGVCSLLFPYILLLARSKRAAPLPPGPVNSFGFSPSVSPYASFQEMERLIQEHGPVVTLRSGSKPIIMIGRRHEAIELMEKEGASLADRPQWVAASEFVSGGMRILLVNAGKRFRKLRRALHSHLQVKALGSYEPLQMHHARNMILDVIDDPDNHICHAKRFAASFILSLTYGKTMPTSANDPDVIAIGRALQRVGMAVRPGAYKVDQYPLLRFIPWYQRELRTWHNEELTLFRNQLNSVRKNINEVDDCFGKYLIQNQKALDLTDDEAAYLAGTMFGAGSATTAATISLIIMAAACFPQAQRTVQAQLDQVLGTGRAPTFSDREELSQVTAFILETYRWRPVAGSGFAHRATKDDRYRIPKGAIVTGNHWSICRDPLFFEDPEEFRPDRWLNSQGRIKEDVTFFNFGFGRRVCPGQHLADKSIFICAALILWAFNISEDSKFPIDTMNFTGGVNIAPKDFTARFEQRIPELKGLLSHYTPQV
ncbi:cytochrome P450 [Hymenopellis radicata]|nr:cytochrome P450 [Hymenopellis radicata]